MPRVEALILSRNGAFSYENVDGSRYFNDGHGYQRYDHPDASRSWEKVPDDSDVDILDEDQSDKAVFEDSEAEDSFDDDGAEYAMEEDSIEAYGSSEEDRPTTSNDAPPP